MPARVRNSKSNGYKSNKRLPEDYEWLINKIQHKWGIRPTELFPPQSQRHPRTWSPLLLNELVKLAEVASLGQVREIFERYRSPITNQTIIDAHAECLRARPQAHVSPEQPNTPGAQATTAQDVVFVASDNQTPTASFTPANGVRRQSRPPSAEACFSPTNFAELMGYTPQTKRRKLQESETESLEIMALSDTATETPDSSQFVFNVPSRSEDSPEYARAIVTLIARACQSFEKQYNEQYHRAHETSRCIEGLETDHTILLQQQEQLKEREDLTREDIAMFENGVRKMQNIEHEGEELAASLKARLEARKPAMMSHGDPQLTPHHETEHEHARTGIRESHKLLLNLNGLRDELATLTNQMNKTKSAIATTNSDLVAKRKQLEEEKNTLVQTGNMVTSWSALAASVTKGVAQSGVLDPRSSPSN